MDIKNFKAIPLNRLDVHDRFEHLKKQDFNISECCQDLINKLPFGNRPFYIFAHARTEEDGINKRLIWQPRLTKPSAQTNSMLFKAYPGTDMIKVIWMIPDRALWKQFERGKITQNKTVMDSINDFVNNRAKLEEIEEDDPTDQEAMGIYLAVYGK